MTAKLSLILQILNRYIEPKGSGWKPGSFQVCLHFLYWLVSLHRQCQDDLAIKGKKKILILFVYHHNIFLFRAGFRYDQKYFHNLDQVWQEQRQLIRATRKTWSPFSKSMIGSPTRLLIVVERIKKVLWQSPWMS